MSFVRFVLLSCGRLVYETVLERFPRWAFGEFYRSLKYGRNFPRSMHMFICWRARTFLGTRMKAQASKKKSCNDFRASEVRCYLHFFQKAFFIRIRVMVQISSS